MSRSLIYRQNRLFKIDVAQLPQKARRSDVVNGLYAAVYEEFKGAAYKDDYSQLTYKERMDALNQYAKDWLEKRGFK